MKKTWSLGSWALVPENFSKFFLKMENFLGHQLILQEGGMLTTICAVLVARLKNSSRSVACACNVGDSLAFVYSPTRGVREITQGT